MGLLVIIGNDISARNGGDSLEANLEKKMENNKNPSAPLGTGEANDETIVRQTLVELRRHPMQFSRKFFTLKVAYNTIKQLTS
jgi:hypothetical protein